MARSDLDGPVIVHFASPTFADPLKSNGGGTSQVKQETDIFASNVARA